MKSKKIVCLFLAAVLTLGIAGTAMAGWMEDENGWWYQNNDGSYPAGSWKLIGYDWYHFDAFGYMQTGWLNDNGIWYYLDESGVMVTDAWVYDDEEWFYMDEYGEMITGFFIDGDYWYYLTETGIADSGWADYYSYYPNYGSGIMYEPSMGITGFEIKEFSSSRPYSYNPYTYYNPSPAAPTYNYSSPAQYNLEINNSPVSNYTFTPQNAMTPAANPGNTDSAYHGVHPSIA